MLLNDSRAPNDLVDKLLPLVRQVMSITDITVGDQKQLFAVRFRGTLISDSQLAFEKLDPAFKQAGTTLLFREENDGHEILGMPGVIQPQASNPLVNVILFLLTLASMLAAGAMYGTEAPADPSTLEAIQAILQNLPNGITFAVSLLGILVAHEFGHYFAARFHRIAVSLPYFLPFPLSLFGTLGAFIRLKEPPKNRRVLLDIGLSGPIAGLIVAVPVLLIGLFLSDIGRLPLNAIAAQNTVLEGNSLLYLALKYIVSGDLLPKPLHYAGLSPFMYWVRYFFIGLPMPFGGTDVLLHPLAWAGWAGLLVTMLNLIPAGQLDGGHAIYVLLGKATARLWPFIIGTLLLLGMVWPGWYIWAGMVFLMGRTYARPRDEITPLDPRRKWLAVFSLVLFVLVFIPVPLRSF
ncbi:MAG: site-2 protease family protein [Anaerolineales bacterium]|jgi:membrane-associated protease RseP (regulator of RpoE activity)|nr:site-2 protease family protein [Anaerolineales bacterium]